MIKIVEIDKFKNLYLDRKYSLPIDREETPYFEYLDNLYSEFTKKLDLLGIDEIIRHEIVRVCRIVLKSIEYYYAGLPHRAQEEFSKAMQMLVNEPLNFFRKTSRTKSVSNDDFVLYRIREVDELKVFDKSSIFHVPYSRRQKIGNSRYSINGFPCLYLSSEPELCYRELEIRSKNQFIISGFKFNRDYYRSNFEIIVYDFGLKPLDIINEFNYNADLYEKNQFSEYSNEQDAALKNFLARYLMWYPVIAAISFVNKSKKDPFSSEYIISQMLLEWLRMRNEEQPRTLIGIRYFSCRNSIRNEKGWNYVFPASGKGHTQNPEYCAMLSECFIMTNPHIQSNIKYIELEEVKRKIDMSEFTKLNIPDISSQNT